MHGHPVDGEALLAHGEFVRALARRLVFDDDRVDDIVQETWLAALEHAPERPRSLRAWLARVVRNVALKTRRSEARRRRREEGAPERLPPEPPPDAVDRLARGRQVVDAVLALDEPYRTTVVLRFYEDLEPKEIARRLGTNGATVRTRLKRGLDMLRARLDRDAGGRRAWCLALLPVLVPGRSVTGGILLMSAQSKLGVAAVLVLAALVGLVALSSAGGRQGGAERASQSSAPPRAGSEGAAGTAGAAQVAEGAIRVVVRVEDGAGVPLAGARVEAHRSWFMEFGIGYGSEDSMYAVAEAPPPVATATTDATGVAVFRHEPRLALVYRATKEGFAKADSDRLQLESRDPDPITLRLGPAHPLTGFVLDEDGKPVADAPVLAADPLYGTRSPDHLIPSRTATAADGSYRFDSLPPRDVALWASFPGGVPWRIATLRFPHLGRLDIVLERGGVVSGTVTDGDSGEPIAGARVRVMGYFQHRAEVMTDAQGRYEVRSLPATLLNSVRLRKEGYYQVFEPLVKNQIGVGLSRGDAMRIDLRMRPAPVLRGTVRGPDGPLAGATLQASNWWSTTGCSFETRIDAEGRYALAVAPGRLQINIGSRDLRIPGALEPGTRPDAAKGDEANLIDMPERGEVVRDFTLELAPLLVDVRGKVVDRDGRPVEAAAVGDTLSGADGTFATRSWKGYPLWASREGYCPGQSEPIEPGRDVEIVLLPAASLNGTVTARGSAATEGAFVLVARQLEPSEDPQGTDRPWRNATRVAASGARYEVRHLRPGRYHVRAGASGCALSAPVIVVLDAAGERVQDFTLEPGEAIAGRIVEAGTGAPVPGAWVHADPLGPATGRSPRDPSRGPDDDEIVVAVSGDDGSFTIQGLARGEYELLAEARGFLRAVSRAATGGAPAAVTLEPALEIRGRATFADGQPAPGLTVFAHPDGDTTERSFASPTRPDGGFVVPGLRRGTYRVVAGGNGAASRTSGPVDAGTGDLQLVVDRAEPGRENEYPEAEEGGAVLEGRIVDPSGQGIGGVQIYASPMKERPSRLGRSTRSGADGRFTIRGVKAEALRLRARFERSGLWQTKEDVVPGRDAPEIVFAPLAGTISGAEAQGRVLWAAPHPYDEKSGFAEVTVLPGGKFEFPGLPPGRYDLSFKTVKNRPQLLLEGGDGLEAGQRELALRATKGAVVAGVVADESGQPIALASVSVSREGSRTASWMTSGDDGRFELTGLRAGVAYELYVRVPGRVQMKRRVEAPVTGLRVTIEAGFSASGRLVGADGKPVADSQLRFIAVGHDAPQEHAGTDSDGRFTVTGLRDGEYRVELWPKVVVKAGDPMPEWQPVGTIRARDQDVELRVK